MVSKDNLKIFSKLKMRCLLFIFLGVAAAFAEESLLLKEFAVGNSQFTADIYRELIKDNPKNFLVCPLSAQIVLALVHAGAGGQTAQQLSTGLHIPAGKEVIQEIVEELTPYLHSNVNYTLNSANKVYIKDGFQIKNQYKTTAVNVFNAEIQNIDFGKNEQAALEINRWVEDKTENKIQNLVSKDHMDASTRAVLINAMYFHGKWNKAFKKDDTKKRTFYLNHQDQIEVDMMERYGSYKLYESSELNAKFLEVPYAGDNITMTFVLPNDKDGLSALEANINDVFVSRRYFWYNAHIVVPKFKFTTGIDFTEILKALGIEEPFKDSADFNEILVDQPLKISKVIQKTFIEVEEEGTTAAAATAVVQNLSISLNYNPPPIQHFIADHPFIFFIKIKDIVLFAGRYTSATN